MLGNWLISKQYNYYCRTNFIISNNWTIWVLENVNIFENSEFLKIIMKWSYAKMCGCLFLTIIDSEIIFWLYIFRYIKIFSDNFNKIDNINKYFYSC